MNKEMDKASIKQVLFKFMTQTNCPKFTQNYILADKFAQLKQLKQWRNIIKVFGVKHTQDHS